MPLKDNIPESSWRTAEFTRIAKAFSSNTTSYFDVEYIHHVNPHFLVYSNWESELETGKQKMRPAEEWRVEKQTLNGSRKKKKQKTR